MTELFVRTASDYARLIVPWVAVGSILAYGVERYLSPAKVREYLGGFEWWRMPVVLLLGMISPLSILSLLPVAGGLVRMGASPGLLLSFFIAERAYDLQSFPVVASLFGVRMAVINAVVIYGALLATAGILRGERVKFTAKKVNGTRGFWGRQAKLWLMVGVGIVVGAGLRAGLPQGLFQRLAGSELGGVASAVVLGFGAYFGPLMANYPVARGFADLGMAELGVLAFLSVSPIVNFVVVMLFSSVVGSGRVVKPVVVYGMAALTMTVVLGWWL